jgi:hypothetical protein
MQIIGTAFLLALSVMALPQQEKPAAKDAPMCATMHVQQPPADDADHQQGVVQRGDEAMGFSHAKTTHHFLLYPDGGAIEVSANDPKDAASRDDIRSHLTHIVSMFAAGDFSVPMLIHAENPPGAETMKRLREVIHYLPEETSIGGRIRISAGSTETIEAVHKFLRFQISDHQTGDSPAVVKAP